MDNLKRMQDYVQHESLDAAAGLIAMELGQYVTWMLGVLRGATLSSRENTETLDRVALLLEQMHGKVVQAH